MAESELSSRDQDIQKLLIAGCHYGGKRVTKQMMKYVSFCRRDGVYVFDPIKMYEKIQVAARIIASVPNAETVCSVSGRQAGQRAVYKFAQFTRSHGVTGRWTPGMLTNQITKKFVEPRLLIVSDPRVDYNALVESSYVNIPVIAICNSDNNLSYVDCAIPCNNRSTRALAMVYWVLTKAVLTIKNELDGQSFNCLPGAFMYRNVEKKDDKKNKGDDEEVHDEEAENADEDQANEEEEVDDGDEKFIE